ncbi:MAG: PorP/SprF family type IX secretion system membrane protein [Bacteroidia bacterium]|nr:PorP/SprF family type IX secretion system membrane protein [Bacteroidia bacterium]
MRTLSIVAILEKIKIAIEYTLTPRMKYCILLVLSFCFFGSIDAQDPRFSQFNASPLSINPALTGVFDGKVRATTNYRDQWASVLGSTPFRTMALGVDYKYELNKGDFFGIGFSMLRDEVGVAKLNQTKGHLSASFIKQLSEGGFKSTAHHLGVGVQVGGGQNSLDWGQLWFSRQFDPSTESVNTNLPNGEINQGTSDFYLDINAGLIWYAIFDGGKSIYAGGSYNHINSPVISFLDDQEETLYAKWIGQIGGEFPINNQLAFMPSVLSMGQGPSLETVAGAAIRYDNRDQGEVALRLGAYVRAANKLDSGMLMDAFIVAANFEVSGFNVGLSYDINVSSLNLATQSRGAFEITLAYIHQPLTASGPSRRRIKNPTF